MTPEELAHQHPRLYHVTEPGAWDSIKQKGLLSTTRLLDLFEVTHRSLLETKRRAQAIPLEHPQHGQVILNDNLPLSEAALAKCLDDGLTPADWLSMLNQRVFFWASEEGLLRLLAARLNRQRVREVLVINTLSLAKNYAPVMELCPINSGATLRKPARRGLNTFTPLLSHSFQEWRKLRGKRDQILEIVVLYQVPDIAEHVVDILRYEKGHRVSVV